MKIFITVLLFFIPLSLNSQVHFNTIFNAIERDDLFTVKKMLANQSELPRNKDGLAPISYAASLGRTEIVEYLISIGNSVDFKEKNFVTPLMLACRNAQVDTIKLLIKKGADINAQTRKLRYSPIVYACKSHSFETFKLVVDNGANIRILTKYKNSLLHILAENNAQNILKFLNNPILDDLNGNSFVSVEQYTKDTLKIASFLLAKGLDINAQNDEGYTPIMYGIKNNNISLVKLFIESKADLKIANSYEETPLKLAKMYNRKQIVKMIAQKFSM